MSNEKINNVIRNVSWGVINKVIMLLFPFLIRTVMLYKLGKLYLGLSSLYTSILQVLNLAELGFGAAIVFYLYEPIAKDDIKRIGAIMHYFKIMYRNIGIAILGIGMLLLPFLSHFIKGEYPNDINIYYIYIIELVNSSLSYMLFSYKSSLITAMQRTDIESRIVLSVNSLQYLVQLAILLLHPNYYLYAAITPIFTILVNILRNQVVDKRYAKYLRKEMISNEDKKNINNKVKSLFIYKLGSVISKPIDSLVVSAFLGLAVLAQYANYFYVITMLFGFLTVYYNAIRPGIGACFVTKSKKENLELFWDMLFVQAWMVGWGSICLLNLYQNFMRVWCGEEIILDIKIVILFVVYFYIWKVQDTVYIFKEAAGLWDKDRIRPLISSFTNIVLNIILVQVIGLEGVIFSTIFSFIIVDLPWSCRILFWECFDKKAGTYYKKLIKYTLITLLTCIVTYYICCILDEINIMDLILRFSICCIIPNIIFFLFYKKSKEFNNITKIFKLYFRSAHDKRHTRI